MISAREQLGPTLGETYRLWRGLLDERLRPLGLSHARWMVLLHLSRRGDGVVQKALAEWLGIEGPTLVRQLDRMAADGWLERRESGDDRRAKTIHLTRQARAAVKKINGVAAELRGQLLQGVKAADIDICLRVMQQIKHKAERL
ncbi:MAG: MarR family transcriptional regulator [Gammaproteobacteria bacterium]